MIYWGGIAIISLSILAVFAATYYWFMFKYNVVVFPLYGSGKDGVFSFGKPKGNKVRWTKRKNAWRKLWPLFNKVEIEPFDSEFIYPGNKIYAFELNNEWVPGRVNISQSEEKIRCEINPVPYYTRNWQSLQHKKNEIEFAKHDWWTDNKAIVITLIICGINLALCGFTVWFTYKFAMGGRADIQSLRDAIQSLSIVQGALPG